LKLKKLAGLVSNCDDIMRDCIENLQTAAKMEDIEESKQLKSRINDAAANKEIFEIKVQVVSLRIKQLKHEKALALCGEKPSLPYGMDPLTFSAIIDCIYEHTENALINDPKSPEGKKMIKQIQSVIKSNPKLKDYVRSK
jgi:hypothetical protein